MSFLLLMMVFRSVVVPLKAVVMNLLASAAAFGVLALAVSGGRLGDLVGIPEATPVPIQLPIGIFAILFGLSMDYEVFLLSRIKEEYDRTGDNALAVADGLAKSARVITAGAAIMVTVFLSFVLGHDVMAKMFGIGLAAAVLIDATLDPDGARAGDHGAARRPQLVAAAAGSTGCFRTSTSKAMRFPTRSRILILPSTSACPQRQAAAARERDAVRRLTAGLVA